MNAVSASRSSSPLWAKCPAPILVRSSTRLSGLVFSARICSNRRDGLSSVEPLCTRVGSWQGRCQSLAAHHRCRRQAQAAQAGRQQARATLHPDPDPPPWPPAWQAPKTRRAGRSSLQAGAKRGATHSAAARHRPGRELCRGTPGGARMCIDRLQRSHRSVEQRRCWPQASAPTGGEEEVGIWLLDDIIHRAVAQHVFVISLRGKRGEQHDAVVVRACASRRARGHAGRRCRTAGRCHLSLGGACVPLWPSPHAPRFSTGCPTPPTQSQSAAGWGLQAHGRGAACRGPGDGQPCGQAGNWRRSRRSQLGHIRTTGGCDPDK